MLVVEHVLGVSQQAYGSMPMVHAMHSANGIGNAEVSCRNTLYHVLSARSRMTNGRNENENDESSAPEIKSNE